MSLEFMDTAMTGPMGESSAGISDAAVARHAGWVRVTHWMVTLSFLALVVSGWVILMCHHRLYWGEVGNDLTPALLELPISRNHRHAGWAMPVPFFERTGSPVSASRTVGIFNQNSWGRSLHFLAAWFLVLPGAVYLVTGVATGHFRRRLWPRAGELTLGRMGRELKDHLRWAVRSAGGGHPYGLLQKCTYCGVVFLVLPLAVVTGLAMSPAITAAFPFLSGTFGGFQSARTIHFVINDWADSIDLLDALHPQTLLAYGMNGSDLPVAHGAPVRLRVETQLGYKSMKYLRRLVVKDVFDDGGPRGNIQNGWSWYAGI